jgi:hypothetical protein
MNMEQAMEQAQQAWLAHGVPGQAEISWAEKRYIELAGPDPEKSAPVRDVLVWVVRFMNRNAWIDLAIDDKNGRVVRVERSRLSMYSA